MSPILEDILIHGHIVAELDDVEPEQRSSVPYGDRPQAVEPPRRRAWLGGIRTAWRGRMRAIPALGALLLLATLACADSSGPLPPRDAVAAVHVAPEQRELRVGETTTLAATPRSVSGRPLEGRVVSWTSSDTTVVAVSSTGRIAAARPGIAVVSAASEGKVGGAVVTVRPGPLARLTLDPPSAVLARGAVRQLTALGFDAAGNALRLGAVVWTTSDPAIATVTTVGATGVVTGGASGTAVITATSEGRSARAEVTVTPPIPARVDRVEVTPAPVVLEVGRTRQLTAVVRDADGNVLPGRSISWTSDNPMAATVGATGLVTALTPGYATIVATSEGKSFGVAVTVPTPEMTEYQLLLVNGTPVPRTLFTTVETGADGVARTVRWDAHEGYFRLANGHYEQLIGFWVLREGSPAVQGAYVYRGTYLYDLLGGGMVFQPSDSTPPFRGAVVDGTLVVARRLMSGTPELTFLHRQR